MIGGDFNTWNDRLGEEAFGRDVGGDRWSRLKAFSGHSPSRPEEATGKYTFDYFFSTPGLKSGPGRVGLVRTGSDHFPIEAVFKIP